MNRVTLLGRLGADPEIKSVQNGDKVANMRVATSESWRDKNTGEKKERTEWHHVVVWNSGLVGVIEKYVKKGSQVLIEGQLRTRKWQDKDGADRYSTEVVLQGFDSRLKMLDGKRDGVQPEHQDTGVADIDDSIPF